MWTSVELRELRVFLALAEQLHFGRTAEALGLTQSRVSQSLRSLEQKLGVRLVDRTSRRVGLTDAGVRFRDQLAGPVDAVRTVVEETIARSRDERAVLRIGLFNAGSGGPHLPTIIAAFEREQACDVEIVELPFADRFGPLRRGEVDVMATRLPLDQPDLVVGPTLSLEPRVLGVASDHPLVAKGEVSIEDVADHEVARMEMLPDELAEEVAPSTTPGGRPIARRDAPVRSTSELLLLVAAGKVVHPTVVSFGRHLAHPDVVYLPITDLPLSTSALAWRKGDLHPNLECFVEVAQRLAEADAPPAR